MSEAPRVLPLVMADERPGSIAWDNDVGCHALTCGACALFIDLPDLPDRGLTAWAREVGWNREAGLGWICPGCQLEARGVMRAGRMEVRHHGLTCDACGGPLHSSVPRLGGKERCWLFEAEVDGGLKAFCIDCAERNRWLRWPRRKETEPGPLVDGRAGSASSLS